MYFTKRLLYIFIPLLALLAVDFTMGQANIHVNLPWDASPGFDAFYGIIATTILITIAKPIMNRFVERKADYYRDSLMPSGYAWFDEAIKKHLSPREIMELTKAKNWGKSDNEIGDNPGYRVPESKNEKVTM